MIDLTAIDGKRFVLNCEHIEKMQYVPETLITLTNGKKYMVKESIDEVKNEVIKYKRRICVYKI